MKALVAVEIGKLALAELPVPVPGDYDALVRMEACAICNSTDHKLLMNEFCPGPFPACLGHEVISTVVTVGPAVKNFRPGDRVFRQRLEDHHVPGGRSCWGGFAEFGLVTDHWAAKGVPYDLASLPHAQQKLILDVEPALASAMVTLMETLDCARSAGAAPGVSFAVVGSGPVGQALAMFAKLLGASPVYAFGRRSEPARRFARVCRVDGYVVGTDFPREVARILDRGGFDVVVEAVGSTEALDTCLRLAGAKGRVGIYGVAPESAPFRPDQKSKPNVSFVGGNEGRAQARLVDFVQQGDVNLSDWVSHRFPLADFQKGFDLLAAKLATKVVLLP